MTTDESKEPLQRRVDRAMDAIVFERGNEGLVDMGADEIAADFVVYDTSMAGEACDDVEACVEDYLAWYRSFPEGTPPSERCGGDPRGSR